VIFVGDDKQLNPVNESNSPVFYLGIDEFELTEIIRHQNDIIDLSRNLDWLYEKRNGVNFEWKSNKELPIDLLIEANGTDDAKFITWTNRIVEIVNREVRNQIYDNPQQLELGEVILMKEPFENYKNNEEVFIETLVNSHVYFDEVDIPNPYVETYLVNGDLPILKIEDLGKYNQNVENLRDKAKLKVISWKKYYEYLEKFASCQYNHAVTVHKSQGSTYGTSIVNVSDIIRNPRKIERNRMLYTAITRAKDKNYLI
jgi:ATP-dependent exoDNAse (exonuclease V) alpha subunit